MHLDELLADAQAQAEPSLAKTEVARGMPAGIELGEERLEQMLEGLRLETDATVGDANPGLVAVVKLGGQLDLALVGRELDGVGQQVDEHGADLVGIDLEGAQVSRPRQGGGGVAVRG